MSHFKVFDFVCWFCGLIAVFFKEIVCVCAELICLKHYCRLGGVVKKPIHRPHRGAQLAMKGYNHVCELAVCICLTGDEPCINYCYLQS